MFPNLDNGDEDVPLIVISDEDDYEVQEVARKRANDEQGTSKAEDVSQPKKSKKKKETREKEAQGDRSSPDVPSTSNNGRSSESRKKRKQKKRPKSSDDSSDDEYFKNKYEEKGEKILVEAAANCEKYDLLPNLMRRGEFDYCLIKVDALSHDRPGTPVPRRVFRSDLNSSSVGLPWEDASRNARIDREFQTFVSDDDATSFFDVEVVFKNLGVDKQLTALENYYKLLETSERQMTFVELIKQIASLASRGKELFPGCLPICETKDDQKTECSVTISQEQCACLLANAFFGLFLEQGRKSGFSTFDLIPLLSSNDFFAVEKLRFFVNYFSRVLKKMPAGCVSFRRVAIKEEGLDFKSMCHLSLSKIGLAPKGIETCHHALQVDFANELIGGGTLANGALQEEIRFLCCPEMIISMLLCPKMRDNEAIFIVGAQQYSDYGGYKDTFHFKPLATDVNQEWDRYRRIRCEVVAIDAIPFGHDTSASDQYHHINFTREVVKAYAGFSRKGIKGMYLSPIATGNWGCGAFNGILLVKFLIQLIAASAAQRNIVYCPFGNAREVANLCYLRDRMVKESVSVADLFNEVTRKWKLISRNDERGGINYLLRRVENGWE